MVEGRGVTSYTYNKDGSVAHKTTDGRLIVPLTKEEAGDQVWLTRAGTEAYLARKLANPECTTGLDAAQARADEAGMPAIAVPETLGQMLTILAKSMRAQRVLEIGTLAGISTHYLACALPADGQIDTIEASPEHAKIAQANFLALDTCPFPTTHVGQALKLLRDPNGVFKDPPGTIEGLPEPGYDLAFVDANKDEYFEYFTECLRLVRKGGVIVFDNAIRNGRIAVPDGTKIDSDCVGLRKMYDWIEKDAGKTVIASAIQTVGDKSWDGFAIVYKL
ncbi:uncharacterized protein CcaverHIS019_0103460 [Cutaneotrichosporon cavernicola]|uniref:O-methyltransferase n=1 Tax=Cutaneotrichosporon cavernicola TaxID=279322 RepID=A0AA48IDA5_9TREE|nr:uncharacterized protein CcaverHIS019_0103460 [Cutaneotrichosporon cavernicola]BEI87628.1 hypothetical protein CcaverHIS019_0103460 [Cutaneotrichosporon cavernicola]